MNCADRRLKSAAFPYTPLRLLLLLRKLALLEPLTLMYAESNDIRSSSKCHVSFDGVLQQREYIVNRNLPASACSDR